jgi:hypothetical protein
MPILAGADHVLSCPGLPEEGLVEAMAVEAAAVVVDDGPVVVLAPLAQAATKTTVATVTRQSTRRASSLVACRVRVCHWEPPRLPRQARPAACHAPHWPTEVLLQK